MRMNKRMEALYDSVKSATTTDDSCLESRLMELLESGFIQVRDAFLLASQEKLAKTVKPESFPDFTGYECFVNHVHIDDYMRGNAASLDALATLKQGFVFAQRIREKLESSFPNTPFTVIVGVGESGCSVRFHSTRDNEPWLSDNLDAYYQEAILVMETTRSA
jgi:hypothetical protein